MKRLVLLSIVVCLFVGCYSIPNVKPGGRFVPQEKTGRLLFTVNIEGDPAGLVFRTALMKYIIPGVIEWYNLKPGRNIIFIKVPAGPYKHEVVVDRSFKRVFTDFELEGATFTVENGVITYCGELTLALDESRNEYGNRVMNFRYAYRDAYPEALAYLRATYPEIPDTVIIRNECPELPEGYYRPVIMAGE
jgi:hypothetical protein